MAKRRSSVNTTVTAGNSVYLYISACCNTAAEKPALVMPKGNHVGEYLGFAPKDADGTLGSWRCGTCRKPCKVSRQNKKPQETANA